MTAAQSIDISIIRHFLIFLSIYTIPGLLASMILPVCIINSYSSLAVSFCVTCSGMCLLLHCAVVLYQLLLHSK